jgi:hypothetical protein
MDRFIWKHCCHFRFSNYEIVAVTNTKSSNDNNVTSLLKKMFTRNKIEISETAVKTRRDDQSVSEMTNTIRARSPKRQRLEIKILYHKSSLAFEAIRKFIFLRSNLNSH